MKIQLNFIKGKSATYRSKNFRKMIFATFLLAFLLCFMFMGYVYIGNYYEIKSYRNRLTPISGKFARLNREAFKMREYKKEWDSLREKISLISELGGKQIWGAPKLQALSKLIPDNIWLSSISINPTNLILKGFALPGDNQGFLSIENFARQLKEDPIFSRSLGDINLSTITRTEAKELLAVSFELSCIIANEESL